MKIVFVNLSEPIVFLTKKIYLNNAILYLYFLTPEKHERVIVHGTKVEPCDVVCISLLTENANRAYDTAEMYRKAGAKVILDGINPTVLPDEALKHSDCVVLGYADEIWERVISDLEQNKLKRRYKGALKNKLRTIPIDRSEVDLHGIATNVIETNRGCLNRCHFCSARIMHPTMIYKDIDDVEKEIKEVSNQKIIGLIKPSFIHFIDNDIFSNKEYSMRLFDRIEPLKIRWYGYTSVQHALDSELLNRAYKSGCRFLLIGFDSLRKESLKSVGKLPQTDSYNEAIDIVHKNHILMQGSFIIGFDNDDPDTIKETASFIRNSELDIGSMGILIPFPGTMLFERLRNEGIICSYDWSKYNGEDALFRMKNLDGDKSRADIAKATLKNLAFPAFLKRSLKILFREKFNLKYVILFAYVSIITNSLAKRRAKSIKIG